MKKEKNRETDRNIAVWKDRQTKDKLTVNREVRKNEKAYYLIIYSVRTRSVSGMNDVRFSMFTVSKKRKRNTSYLIIYH